MNCVDVFSRDEPRRTVISQGVNDIWAIDLVDFAKQKGGYVTSRPLYS